MTLRVTPNEIVAHSSSPLLVTAPWWKRCRLGDIATITNGGAFKSSLFNTTGDGLPLIRIRDVGKTQTKTYYSGEYDNKYIVRHGDLLIGMDGDFRISNWQGPVSLLNQRVCKVSVIDDSMYCHSLLEYVIQPYLDEVNKLTSAVTVKHLSSRTVADLPIPLPPRAEQERIVDAIEEHFSRINAAESAAQTALAKLDTLRRTVLTAAFSGRLVDQDPDDEPASVLLERIAAEHPQRRTRHAAQSANQRPSPMTEVLPSGWASSVVGDIFEIVGGSTPRTDNPDYWDGDIPWLTPDDLSQHNGIFVGEGRRSITEAGLKSSSTHMLPENSVLFSSRAPIGYVAIASNPLCTNQGFKNLIPTEKILPKYVYWYLRHSVPEIRDMGSGTTFKEISKKRMAVVPFVLAPTNEQKRIVTAIEEHFSRIDAAKALLERCLQRCGVLRRSVLAAAFSGRLVDQDPDDEPASVLLERIAAEQLKLRTRRKTS